MTPLIPAHKTSQVCLLCGLLGMCQSSWSWICGRYSIDDPAPCYGLVHQQLHHSRAPSDSNSSGDTWSLSCNSKYPAENRSIVVYAGLALMLFTRIATGIPSSNVIWSQLSFWRSLLSIYGHVGAVTTLFWNSSSHPTRRHFRLYLRMTPALFWLQFLCLPNSKCFLETMTSSICLFDPYFPSSHHDE